MSRLFDTWQMGRSSGSAVELCCLMCLGCCFCACENLYTAHKKMQTRESCSSILQITLGLAGLAAGVYADVLITPEFYDAMVDFFKENSEAEELSIKAFAGLSNAIADLFLPFAGFNLGHWGARALSYGIEKFKGKFFNDSNQLSIQDEEIGRSEGRRLLINLENSTRRLR